MKIAVVGGIGSGKSEVVKAAESLGIACLSADAINAALLTSPSYVYEIEKLFPSAVEKGAVNKKELARIVFNDETARAKLNALAHPLVLKRIEQDARSPLVVELPLIFESGAEKLFDVIIAVVTPLENRINRVVASRDMTREEVLARINSQVEEDRYLKAANVVLENDGTLCDLRNKAKEVFESLCL
ncbi:MAG: dephospho-CoA kinase [Clostridia bacterium]|nr:dephospho-CoA kinase [Clostridia bacterium]